MKSFIFIFLALFLSIKIFAFDFIDVKVENQTLIFSTVEERESYPFYIEQWINESWVVITEVYGIGGIDTNVYKAKIENMFYGINEFRIKKETGWNYFSFSSPTTYFNNSNKVYPFVKDNQIIFSGECYFKLVTTDQHIVLSGKGATINTTELSRGKYILWCNNRKKQLVVKRNRCILNDRW